MYSPVHPDTALVRAELESGLQVFTCPKSGGCWIPLSSYFQWREQHLSDVDSTSSEYSPAPAAESAQRALICPESGCILVRYPVGRGLDIQIDRSPKTGGIWLDSGEWEALKSKGLHRELHLIFTAPYQRRERTERVTRGIAERLESHIGREDFTRVTELKRWLSGHPRKRDILGYLLDDEES